MITIYHNPRCSKSREALEIVNAANDKVEVIEYLKTPPSSEELKNIIKKLGIKAEVLVRKGEELYKSKYKGKIISEEEWVDILSKNPILIERPVVVIGNKAVIGRPPESIKTLF